MVMIYLRNNVSKYKKLLASKLRNNPTPAESRLWQYLRNTRLGFKFRRSVIIRGFIADFYCPSSYMVIEVDGSSHDNRKDYDQNRDFIMSRLGILTLRFSNSRIFNDINNVLDEIQTQAKARINYRQTHRQELRHLGHVPEPIPGIG
jgi:very-short-patch-repair endonuclease